MSDIEVDEDEVARLRALWFPQGQPFKPALSPQEKAVARKLIGQENAERLSRHQSSNRVFKPTPVVVTFEYYYYDVSTDRNIQRGWRINRLENRRITSYDQFDSEQLCMKKVKELKSAGHSVRPFKPDQPPPNPRKNHKENRKAILEKLGGFKF